MQAPHCKICGSTHWPREGHKFNGNDTEVDRAPAAKKAVGRATSRTKEARKPRQRVTLGGSAGGRDDRGSSQIKATPSKAPGSKRKVARAGAARDTAPHAGNGKAHPDKADVRLLADPRAERGGGAKAAHRRGKDPKRVQRVKSQRPAAKKQGWARKAYNDYMRVFMAKRRARLKREARAAARAK